MLYNLAQEMRIRKKTEFDHVFSARRCLLGKYFVIYFRENKVFNVRLGVIVSRRNVRFAVARNRIKRVIREFFRLKQHRLSQYDVVVVVKQHVDIVTNNELRECLNRLIRRLTE